MTEMDVQCSYCGKKSCFMGDDVLFIKHSKAPVTVIGVKDFALAHNPLGALYTSRALFSRLNTRRPKK